MEILSGHPFVAEGLYREALAKSADRPNPGLDAELQQKRALAHRLGQRMIAAWIAFAVILVAIAFLTLRRARGGPRVPTEALYVLPVYLLILVGARGHEAKVVQALLMSAGGSFVLILLSGMTRPARGISRVVQAALLLLANCALFYLVLYRTELIDKLVMTALDG